MSAASSNALGAILAAEIAAQGPISIEDFMSRALGDPLHGYYMKQDPFGAAGDFTTAPEISQMFGEMIGLCLADHWLRAGSPSSFILCECGPGRGTLMADLWRATKIVPGFHDAAQIVLVETSPVLRAKQVETLKAVGVDALHVSALHDVPPGPLWLVANEFFDALPIRQFVKMQTGWHARLVGLDEAGALQLGLAPEPYAPITLAAPDGSVLEVMVAGLAFMKALAQRIAFEGGLALIIDYGHRESGFGDTLQAMRRHECVAVLDAPGDCDLTAHVDFAALARVAVASGADVYGPQTQGAFLKALGIEARAAKLRDKAEKPQDIDAALARLTAMDVRGMGELFKVLAIGQKGDPAPAGLGVG
jgi:NADH dehydrogenase [ubiquinone] 1 alpha subcomplex assembly factor 7